jgi:hypothetical protein
LADSYRKIDMLGIKSRKAALSVAQGGGYICAFFADITQKNSRSVLSKLYCQQKTILDDYTSV